MKQQNPQNTRESSLVFRFMLGLLLLASVWLLQISVLNALPEAARPKDQVARQVVQQYLAAKQHGYTSRGCVLAGEAAGAWSRADDQLLTDRWKRIERWSCNTIIAPR